MRRRLWHLARGDKYYTVTTPNTQTKYYKLREMGSPCPACNSLHIREGSKEKEESEQYCEDEDDDMQCAEESEMYLKDSTEQESEQPWAML